MMEVRLASTSPRQPGPHQLPEIRRRPKRHASPADDERPARRSFAADTPRPRVYSLIAPVSPPPVRHDSSHRVASHADPGDRGRPPPIVDDPATSVRSPSLTSATTAADSGRRPAEDQGRRDFRAADGSELGSPDHPAPHHGPLPTLQHMGFFENPSSDHQYGHSSISAVSNGGGNSQHLYPVSSYHQPHPWVSGNAQPQQHPISLTTPHFVPYPSTVSASRFKAAPPVTPAASLNIRRGEPPPPLVLHLPHLSEPTLMLHADVAHVATNPLSSESPQSLPGPRGFPRFLGHGQSIDTSYGPGSTTDSATATAGTSETAGSPLFQPRYPLSTSPVELTDQSSDIRTGQIASFATSGPTDVSGGSVAHSTLEGDYYPQYSGSYAPTSLPAVSSFRAPALLPEHSRPQSPPLSIQVHPSRAGPQSLHHIRKADYSVDTLNHFPSAQPLAPYTHRPQLPQLPPFIPPRASSPTHSFGHPSSSSSFPLTSFASSHQPGGGHGGIHRHFPYPSLHQQPHHSMDPDSDAEWYVLHSGQPPMEDETPHMKPETAITGPIQPYRPASDSVILPILASNGMDQHWEDVSVELTREEAEIAAGTVIGVQPFKPGPGRGSGSSGRKPGRRQFNDQERRDTGNIRKQGACLRCKMQRVRCVLPDSNDPTQPCKTCSIVSYSSKKTIHHIPCRRYKLSDAIFARQGGLNLTKRWEGVKLKDVGDRPDNLTRIIELMIFYTHDDRKPLLYSHPIRFEVCKFIPRPGDSLERAWLDPRDGRKMTTRLTSFALLNIQASAEQLAMFIDNHAIHAMYEAVQHSEPIIKDTYYMAVRHYHALDLASEQRTFLCQLFRLWFAMRLTTGSAFISGEDKLDMEPETRPYYPLGERISVPRMITAQVDSILTTKFLREGTRRVTGELEKYVRGNDPKHWFTIFLATFILLHEISHATRDRARYARDNLLGIPFSLPSVVRDQHYSANILLLHWHYYKSELDPSNTDFNQTQKTPMALLNEEQKAFTWAMWGRVTRGEVAAPSDKLPQKKLWEEPLYFVQQMFQNKWGEMPTFSG